MADDSMNAVYGQLKPVIDRQFAAGRFVAIDDGQIVADAPTHRELTRELQSRGMTPKNMLIVQAGADYPMSAVIF
ncbi:MAG TPA: hypothetical protein VGI40_23125 [Pirellulaceae bacterium]|jgi:hypothetical protein